MRVHANKGQLPTANITTVLLACQDYSPVKRLIDPLFVDCEAAERSPSLRLFGRANGDAVRRAFVQPTRKNRLISESIW